MRIYLLAAVLSLGLLADSQQKVEVSTQLNSYNYSSMIKMQKKRQLKRLTKVKPDEVERIASSQCKGAVRSITLKNRGQLLFYAVNMDSCIIEINALDGAIIHKELKR